MQDIWVQTNPGGANVDQILAYVMKRSEHFDRKIRRRNRREWIGGIVGLVAMAACMAMFESMVEITFGVSMTALVLGICLHLWFEGRSGGAVDPSLSRPLYRAALERKFHRQVRMLRNATYWFLLPLFATGSATVWAYQNDRAGEADWLYFALVLAGALIAWYANNVRGAKCIRSDWEKVRRALDDGKTL